MQWQYNSAVCHVQFSLFIIVSPCTVYCSLDSYIYALFTCNLCCVHHLYIGVDKCCRHVSVHLLFYLDNIWVCICTNCNRYAFLPVSILLACFFAHFMLTYGIFLCLFCHKTSCTYYCLSKKIQNPNSEGLFVYV